MADYWTSTVIDPPVPIAGMTPLERFILENCFEHEISRDEIYFFAEHYISTSFAIERETLDLAIKASKEHVSSILQTVAEQIEAQESEKSLIKLDFSGESAEGWGEILQDIVQRSQTIDYFTAISSFQCSKMRSDAFGGLAVLITADEIRGKSTHDVIDELMNDAKVGPYAPAKPKNEG
jgi:hypothetical protein